MKLNKTICASCTYRRMDEMNMYCMFEPKSDMGTFIGWRYETREEWQFAIPENCVFKLEHIVSDDITVK